MGDLLGFVLELLFEVVIQIIFEEGIGTVLRVHRRQEAVPVLAKPNRRYRIAPFVRATLSRTNPPLTILKFTLWGLGLGVLSTLFIPHPLVHPSKLHGISLLISPVITGLVMGYIGRMVRRRGHTPVQIESFAYGFTFAFAMALIRYFLVH